MTTKQRYSAEIKDVIAKARFSRSRATVTTEDGAEIYAYPKPDHCVGHQLGGDGHQRLARDPAAGW